MQITPRANVSGNHYNGYVSAPTWDFTASQISVQVVQAASADQTNVLVVLDNNNWYRLVVDTGTLYFQQMVGGVKTTLNSLTYDAAQHRFWRIRHDAAANQIVFETSGDRVSWATQATATPQFTITALHVELSAGTYQSWASPGTTIFDNLRFVH